ncbi:unnamed protein product [Brassicogethes aeneus]|uniref:Phosphatase phospho2 n=1 Tax=Brassicogethes aeneus TaxID=1431903 RepID=A0A9P0AYK9_BRAAE|nr:unnamed protein product [Brassicogethes aeneus]
MAFNLIAFDFDHTIVDDNTDTVVAALINKNQIPDSLRTLYRKDGWTSYMQGIFKLLHQNDIKESRILEAIKSIKPVPGICELIQKAHNDLNCHVIIISDSNTYFIEHWLKYHELDKYVAKVFSNPAELDSMGLLNIKMYHFQDYCKLSSKNLCKGQILLDYIKEQNSNGIDYQRIVYCGDGSNDFCPILKLNENDIGCVRKDYKCIQLVSKVKTGEKIDNVFYNIKCNICEWNNGYDILGHLESSSFNECE